MYHKTEKINYYENEYDVGVQFVAECGLGRD